MPISVDPESVPGFFQAAKGPKPDQSRHRPFADNRCVGVVRRPSGQRGSTRPAREKDKGPSTSRISSTRTGKTTRRCSMLGRWPLRHDSRGKGKHQSLEREATHSAWSAIFSLQRRGDRGRIPALGLLTAQYRLSQVAPHDDQSAHPEHSPEAGAYPAEEGRIAGFLRLRNSGCILRRSRPLRRVPMGRLHGSIGRSINPTEATESGREKGSRCLQPPLEPRPTVGPNRRRARATTRPG